MQLAVRWLCEESEICSGLLMRLLVVFKYVGQSTNVAQSTAEPGPDNDIHRWVYQWSQNSGYVHVCAMIIKPCTGKKNVLENK